MYENMQPIAEQAQNALAGLVPFLIINAKSGLCDSVTIKGSFDKPETWTNKIFQNSRYFLFIISPKGRTYTQGETVSLELYSSHNCPKFRKTTGTPEKVIAKLKEWIETVLQER